MEFQKHNFERRQIFPEGEKGKGGPKEILNVQLKERPKEQKFTSSNPVCQGNGAPTEEDAVSYQMVIHHEGVGQEGDPVQKLHILLCCLPETQPRRISYQRSGGYSHPG